MSTHPQQRVALVTGAARGIGAACARRLGAEGYAVVGVDICHDDPAVGYALGSRAELDAVLASIGPDTLAVEADVRDETALDAAVAAGVERFGGLDAVVAAAGIFAGGHPAWRTGQAQWDANIDINLSGVWKTFAAALPAILRRGSPRHGRVVAVASAAGMRGHPNIAAYSAAKHGVIGLVRSLASELGATGITANAVCPGSVGTDILEASRQAYDLASTDEFAVHHVIGRLLEPEEIAAGVAWLCSPEQDAVTGIALPVDGGRTI